MAIEYYTDEILSETAVHSTGIKVLYSVEIEVGNWKFSRLLGNLKSAMILYLSESENYRVDEFYDDDDDIWFDGCKPKNAKCSEDDDSCLECHLRIHTLVYDGCKLISDTIECEDCGGDIIKDFNF